MTCWIWRRRCSQHWAPGGWVATLAPGSIVVARELLPRSCSGSPCGVAGIAMAEGGPPRAAILAAAMGTRHVALGPQILEAPAGNTVVLDAAGWNPADGLGWPRRAQLAAGSPRACAGAPPTGAARPVARPWLANIGSVAEARAAIANGAEGCGLLRTEFLFLDRAEAPTPEEQAHAYQQIADVLV